MDIFDEQGFRAFALSLRGSTLHDQWESCVAKVGGKVYAVYNVREGTPSIAFKCPEETFEILTALDGIVQAPYFAKRQWVAVSAGAAIAAGDLRSYIMGSYKRVATSLTRKAQVELGLAE